ncbi:SDR family NAD(P)-dependent oxidoreductase [Nonomuraea typhae]|uniref:SDR family NAD(P)-dependent oxidoreductase n=1 Tax=Nonomuraea typhae TaxID=2603600 RepID=UPI0012F9DA86|nr:SDR family NAD(P)-dependent oxidoreductase [Nonomuraea typhae]
MKIIILGAGPGLGMSMAHRFGREGFAVALVSRTGVRHGAYRAELSRAGIEAGAHVADVTDRKALETALAEIGDADVVYYGPAAEVRMAPLVGAEPGELTRVLEATIEPAATVAAAVLPRMLERRHGTLLFAGGLSGRYPMPMLGTLAPASAALRMYVLTLAESLKEHGIHAATLTIGGLIERGDIHTANPHLVMEGGTLNPDDIADTAWDLYRARESHEAEFIAPAIREMLRQPNLPAS